MHDAWKFRGDYKTPGTTFDLFGRRLLWDYAKTPTHRYYIWMQEGKDWKPIAKFFEIDEVHSFLEGMVKSDPSIWE